MSLKITIRANGTKEGGETFELPAEGDNGDQEINTIPEAEAALAKLGTQPADTAPEKINSVFVGEKEYTRKQLEDIRDGKGGVAVEGKVNADTKPAAGDVKADGASTNDGVAHVIALNGGIYYGPDGGESGEEDGYLGGTVGLTYTPRVSLLNGDGFRVTLDPIFGLSVISAGKNYLTPGGEEANSTFTGVGGTLGLGARFVPPVADHRLWVMPFGFLNVMGLITPATTEVSATGNCTPGDDSGIGREECSDEPAAGPRKGNAGTTGLKDNEIGSSRGTSGAILGGGGGLTIGVDVFKGDFGSVALFGTVDGGANAFLTDEGHGSTIPFVRGSGGVMIALGGNAVERKSSAPIDGDDDDQDGVTNDKDKCENTPKTEKADEDGCGDSQKVSGLTVDGVVSSNAADAAGQQFIVKLDPAQTGEVKNAKIVGNGKDYDVTVDPTKLEETGELSVTPKEKLPAGKYTFEFDIENGGVKKRGKIAFEVKDVKALETKITPDQGNAPAENTASNLSFGVTTNKAVTITPRFVLQGSTAGLQKNFYPNPTSYPVDASQPGQATSFAFKTPDNLPAGKYTVIFDLKSSDGTTKRVTSEMEVKKMDAKPVFEIAPSFKVGDTLAGKMKPSEKVAAPGLPVTYVVSGPGGSGPQRTATLTDKSEDLNLSCPPALLTQGGKIYRTSKKGTYKVTVTYSSGKTVEQTFEVK